MNTTTPASPQDAWAAFCDALKAAGQNIIEAPSTPDNALDKAEGYRYLARLTRAGLESFLESSDSQVPEFRRPVHETIKMGMDNPDNIYLSAPINGKQRYRIWGQRNTVHYLGFGTQAGGYGKTGNLETTGYLEAQDMEIAADGSFEIIVSSERPEGVRNWLPARADSRMVQVRQTHMLRKTERAAEVHIELLDTPAQPRHFSPERLAPALQGAAQFVAGTAHVFKQWVEGMRQHPNTLPRFDPDVAFKAGGDPHIAYYHSWFDLADDEALLISFTPPECQHWNFQLANYWLESLDYRYWPVHLNKGTAHYEADGSVRIIVSKTAPSTPQANWLDTCGRNHGSMCLRWIKAATQPQPQCQVIKLAALDPAK